MDLNKLVHIFQIKTLLFSGFKPHLDSCLKCQKKIVGQARFSLKEGGLVCLNCSVLEGEYHLISPGTVASILHIEKSEWKQVLKLSLTEKVREELKYVLNNFLVYHLGRRVKSQKYL